MMFFLPILAIACGIAAVMSRGPRVRARDRKGRFVAHDPKTIRNEGRK